MSKNSTPIQIEKSIALAKTLHPSQKNKKTNVFSERMGPIISNPNAKNFLIKLMDTSFRTKNHNRISKYVMTLLKSNNHESVFNKTEQFLLSVFKLIGHKLPFISIPLMLQQVKQVTAPILFFVGSSKFEKHAKKRQRENILLNVNLIGEALIGEKEAAQRIQNYIDLLNDPQVNYISIKISTIYSQINALAFDRTVEILVEKLSVLYNELLSIEQKTGQVKFINLDMEEYRDLAMTIATFTKTLDKPEFHKIRAGIVLQAYLPDSYQAVLDLQKWAMNRTKNNGAPVKVRLVKGANLEMEATESSLEDWPLAPYNTKLDTDANYKKMLLVMLDKNIAPALNTGIASHNIFDLAFALNLVKEQGIEEHIDFEMLEGMADDTVSELLKQNVNLILYTPIVKTENYNSAIAYLVRRLDEGTQKGNFLKEGFKLEVGSEQWDFLENQFKSSIAKVNTVQEASNRIQNRATEKPTIQTKFTNVANTDWIIENNRNWISEMKTRWKNPLDILGTTISVSADVEEKDRQIISLESWNGIHPWKYELADEEDYSKVISADSEWYVFSSEKKAKLLRKAAVEIEKNRADLIGVAVAELGKTIMEVDVEVSEAIDFANYYAQSLLDIESEENIEHISEGIHLILSPWNFPIAIPIGGVLASLAAGKRVILKPSQNAAACALLISQALWKAGIPKSAFAFLPANEKTLDPFLTDPSVFDAIILTGGTDTAKFLLDRTPELKLYAETGGKNATIVTALADREQAISNIVQSAFGNTGQKCSATSLLILEEEIFNDASFKELLKDAIESKTQGNPWNFKTDIGPLAVKISDKIKKSIATTSDKEWLLKPTIKNDFFMSPGVKWGVTKSDFEYNNELFGPILSVMSAKDLKEAVSIVNNTEFGLTSGIESLDPNEVNYWLQNIEAGNLYTNRSTTGAIVQRQPFGGMKASNFGFGMKAGGKNYVLQFLTKKTKSKWNKTVKKDYQKVYNQYFSKIFDYSKIRGQHNLSLYLKPEKIIVFYDNNVLEADLNKVKFIEEILNVETKYINTQNLNNWQEFRSLINHKTVIRVLNKKRIDIEFLKFCHSKAIHVYSEKPSNYGRYEFLNYLTEQSQSINYHRYGNKMGVESI
jgi:RHH-type proline utilization regulon transcriptional repressor/proline dehydrogenase/delta 1-pyrroline-5-carboxylate dehydrogenase